MATDPDPTATGHPAPQRPLRVGVYVDAVYREHDGRLFSNAAAVPFLRFVDEFGARVGSLTMIGRSTDSAVLAPYPFSSRATLHPLPYYPSLRAIPALAGAGARTLVELWRVLDAVDVVLACGPHPFGLALALMAVVRGRPVVLGSREDTMAYLANRLPSPRWRAALIPMHGVDLAFRGLARRHPAAVVGRHLEARFGGPRPGLLAFEVSLVAGSQLARGPHARPWGEPRVALLSVGRVEPEKNPLLLAALIGRLEQARPGRYGLTVVGSGRMLDELRDRCVELGVDHVVDLVGFVPFGDELLRRYREADAFVHTARAEAFGQVLVEAMACATPVVATDVGGVRDLLGGGRAGLLVAPDDLEALAGAVLGLDDEPGRTARVRDGLELARALTLEATAARLARFVATAATSGC